VSYDPRHFVVGAAEFSARRRDERTRYRLETPIHIYTVFTHRCLTNCLYCYAERPTVREMSTERWRDVLDEMVELGIHLASPDNGDTPARRDGVHLLEMLVRRGILFLLSTKVPLTAGQIDGLMAAGFDDPIRGRIHRPVQLSIDAVDDDVSRRLLGTARPLPAAHRRTFVDFVRWWSPA
jgi:MoaA/NifB/PqqE/SkfB family radical SAM enzyme